MEKNTLKPDFLWSKLFLCMIRKNMSCLLLIYIKLVKICSTAIMLTFTLKNDKEHNLEELFKASRGYAPELIRVFPVGKNEEERLFKILVYSYIEARYNPEFKVSREDVEDLMVKVEKFEEVTKQVCERRIKEYEKLRRRKRKGSKNLL